MKSASTKKVFRLLDTQQMSLTPTLRDGRDVLVEHGVVFKWFSSRPQVAKVATLQGSNGVTIVGEQEGITLITASWKTSGKQKYFRFRVEVSKALKVGFTNPSTFSLPNIDVDLKEG